jgi:hypothetical protein
MLSYFDRDLNEVAQNMGRHHPWTVTVGTAGGRYVDFKASPDLIRETLEDLPRVAGSIAESAIVDFLTWANGPTSVFETNDFGVRPLKSNDSGISPKPLEQQCRVGVLFRDLARNTESGDLIPTAGELEAAIKRTDPDFDQACWGWCLWPHLFIALGAESPTSIGHVIQYNLWAWGDDPDEVHAHIVRGLANLRVALQQVEAC